MTVPTSVIRTDLPSKKTDPLCHPSSSIPSSTSPISPLPNAPDASSFTSTNRFPHPRSRTSDDGFGTAPRASSFGRRPIRPVRRTLLDYIVGFDSDLQFDAPLEDAWCVATKRRGVYSLIQVPTRLERLLFFGQAICLHDLLTAFTFLPLRLVIAAIHLVFTAFLFPIRFLFGRRRTSEGDHQKWTRTLVTYFIDLTHISLLVLTVIVLRAFDTSRIYHSIRGQSVIKLYVVFNAVEIFDRLCSSFGVDVLDSLGWTTASAVTFFTRRSTLAPTSAHARALQGAVLLTRMAFDYVFALAYVVIHASLLLTWVVTLNVAINTQNNALLTLLVSNNFVELKGSAFKSFKVPNVFQIACSDAVERFQLTMFLALMMVVTSGDRHLFVTWAIIYGCEVIVDWIKHAFTLKFNRMSHRVYRHFGLVICEDMVRTRSQTVVRSVGGSAVSKRIGFVSLPLAALVVRMTSASVLKLPLPAVALVWLTLVGIKCFLSVCLIGHAWRRICRGDDSAEEDRERDEYWVQQLLQVERFDLVKKS